MERSSKIHVSFGIDDETYKTYMVVKMNKTHEASKPGRVMNSLTTYTASEARNRFSDIFNEAHYGKPVLIDKHGRKVAVVSMSVLERLADLEACIDSMQAQQALEEFQRTGGKTMEEIEKELGLE